MKIQHSHRQGAHGHMWIVGSLGVAAGLALMLYVPSFSAISQIILLFAAFHLVGALVLTASLYVMLHANLKMRSATASLREAKYDFGWTPGWVLGPLIASLLMLSSAVAVQVVIPGWWPVSLMLAILAALFFAGFLFSRSSQRLDHSVLPMVDLLSSQSDLVLDGGCGAGRTTIALAKVLNKGRIVALDRFDADYIAGGGRALLEHNLRLAGITDQVDIEHGDLTQLPFPDQRFDSCISAHAIDHLGTEKARGLQEMFRVLRPGGRFLLVVWVPGWAMFSVVNILSFLLTPKKEWRRMARHVGFTIHDEGMFNGVWFLLLKKGLPVA